MLPSIQEGDLVVVSPANWTEVHPGEVVVFTASDGMVAHRLVAVKRCYQGVFFRTKGDSFDWEDSLVSPDRIVGKVLFLIRNGTPIAVPPLPARTLWKLWLRRVARLLAAMARRLKVLLKAVK
jgi:signal peptidase I